MAARCHSGAPVGQKEQALIVWFQRWCDPGFRHGPASQNLWILIDELSTADAVVILSNIAQNKFLEYWHLSPLGKVMLICRSAVRLRLSLTLSGTILLLLTACSSNSKSPLAPELFARIYTEVVMQSSDSTSADSLGNLRTVLERHNVSREEFEASQTFFQDHPELWLDVFKDVEENLKQLKTEREKETPSNP